MAPDGILGVMRPSCRFSLAVLALPGALLITSSTGFSASLAQFTS